MKISYLSIYEVITSMKVEITRLISNKDLSVKRTSSIQDSLITAPKEKKNQSTTALFKTKILKNLKQSSKTASLDRIVYSNSIKPHIITSLHCQYVVKDLSLCSRSKLILSSIFWQFLSCCSFIHIFSIFLSIYFSTTP